MDKRFLETPLDHRFRAWPRQSPEIIDPVRDRGQAAGGR
jgi:hypothetical protein